MKGFGIGGKAACMLVILLSIVPLYTSAAAVEAESKTGGLTVLATVSGDGADKNLAFSFTVTLADTSIQGMYGDMIFIGGAAMFTLQHGEHRTAVGLPAGIRYTVKEETGEGYAVSAAGNVGRIKSGFMSRVAFLHYKGNGTEAQVRIPRRSHRFAVWAELLGIVVVCVSIALAFRKNRFDLNQK